MELGFETVGNATLIVHDRYPLLVTDPWIEGSAYFGSWSLGYAIPPEQQSAIESAKWVWFSHGHPDHLNPTSLPKFSDRQILLANHVGGRIAEDLRQGGFRVIVLSDNRWLSLSERVRVMCLADYNQDSVLLVDIDGRLVVDLNDSMEKGWGSLLRRIIRSYRVSFLLRLAGYGDADMINFFDEQGDPIPSAAQLRKQSNFAIGAQVAQTTDTFGTRFFVPFSSFHRYQRTDSDWANRWTTGLADIALGYQSGKSEILPAFIRYDCISDTLEELNPAEIHHNPLEPEVFGDVWSDELGTDEMALATSYFRAIEHLSSYIDFVNLKIGGRDHLVSLGSRHGKRGVTFEAPRHSLMKAVEYNIFDDLLIGNFMRTTLHGKWPESRLYPDVAPYVAKYADNGGARTKKELRQYFAQYRRHMGNARYPRHVLERTTIDAVRARLRADSPAAAFATRTYRRLVSRT